MNAHTYPSLARRVAWFFGGAVFAGGLFWSFAAFASGDPSAKVAVRVDSAPIPAVVGGEPSSYAPVVRRVAPSVVKVLVTERAKNVAAPDLPHPC